MAGSCLLKNLKYPLLQKRTAASLHIEEIYRYVLNSAPEKTDEYSHKSDFVFNLACVNRPKNAQDLMKGNFGLLPNC